MAELFATPWPKVIDYRILVTAYLILMDITINASPLAIFGDSNTVTGIVIIPTLFLGLVFFTPLKTTEEKRNFTHALQGKLLATRNFFQLFQNLAKILRFGPLCCRDWCLFSVFEFVHLGVFFDRKRLS